MSIKKYLNWEECNFTWENNPYTWNEVYIIIEVVTEFAQGGGSAYRQLSKEKKKVLIKVVANIKGKEFSQEAYKNEDISVIVKDVELVAKEMFGIELEIKI